MKINNFWKYTRKNSGCKNSNLFLFDFDDTLYPSRMFAKVDYPDLIGNTKYEMHVPPRIDLVNVLISANNLLEFCQRYGEVYVVSTAGKMWLDAMLIPYISPEMSQNVYSVPLYNKGLKKIYISSTPGFDKYFFFKEKLRSRPYAKIFIIGDGSNELFASLRLKHKYPNASIYFVWVGPRPAVYRDRVRYGIDEYVGPWGVPGRLLESAMVPSLTSSQFICAHKNIEAFIRSKV